MKNSILLFCAVAFLVTSCKNKNQEQTQETTTVVPMNGTITLPKQIVEPGEEITINYTAEGTIDPGAWIGIIPSTVPHGTENTNDENDVTYKYLEKDISNGSLTFTAPADSGSYDFRMNDKDQGKEITSVSFKVSGTTNTITEITPDKNSYAKGEKMSIGFKALVSWDKQAWMAIVPASTAHGSADEADKVDVSYEYLEKRSKGTIKFTAPTTAGSYSVRMYDALDGKEVKSVDIAVN